MKWIKDIDNDYVNLDQIENIYLEDLGIAYPFRFLIKAQCVDRKFILNKFRTEYGAKAFMRTLVADTNKDKDV
jgi:hypothetical protein